MKITANRSGDALYVALDGRLNTTTAPELEREMADRLDGVAELTMDFSGLAYISSAGLRVLLSLYDRMSGQGVMKLTHVNEIVMEIFDATGFSGIMTIE